MYGRVESREANCMDVYHTEVVYHLFENYRKLDRYKVASVFDNLEESVREMNILLQNDKLRTYGNQRLRIDKPIIGERPSLDDLLLRLERQAIHARTLAENCFKEPPANVDETETLAGVVSILRRLAERVVPNQTTQATSSNTEPSPSQ